MSTRFDLFLFSTNPVAVCEAVAAGVAGVVIDWEQSGKAHRQRAADTEINAQTLDDLRAIRAATTARILCRINAIGATSRREIDDAVAAGVDEILLPMVRTVEEVRVALDLTRDRCGVGILVETVAAVDRAEALAALPLSRVYVGLNDLTIDRGGRCIFSAVLDGTVERVREKFSVPFGFAGMTMVHRGFPVPCRLLIAEMARLGCDFTFLRRSFHRDIQGHVPAREVPDMLWAVSAAKRRSQDDIERDRCELHGAIRQVMLEHHEPLPVAP
jgi:hypothetical protein